MQNKNQSINWATEPMCYLSLFSSLTLSTTTSPLGYPASATLTFLLIFENVMHTPTSEIPFPKPLFPYGPDGHLAYFLTSLVLYLNIIILKHFFISIYKTVTLHSYWDFCLINFLLLTSAPLITTIYIYISSAGPWCPNRWSNIILDISVWMFLDKIDTEIVE